MDVLPNSTNVRAGNDVVVTTVCVCVVFPCTLAVKFVDAPGEVEHEEDHTGFLHFHSAVLALIFLAWRIPPFLSLVNREIEFCVLTNDLIVLHWLDIFVFVAILLIYFLRGKIPARVTTPRSRGYTKLTTGKTGVYPVPGPPQAAPATLCITLTKTKNIHECRFA